MTSAPVRISPKPPGIQNSFTSETWVRFPLKRIIQFITSGSRGWAEHYSDDGVLFLRIGNLTRNSLNLDLDDVQRLIVPPGVEGERTKVRAGDLLFSITAYLGSVAVVPPDLEDAYVSQHVSLVRIRTENVLPNWIGWLALSNYGQEFLTSTGYGGTKVQLGLDDIRSFPLILPPIEVQKILDRFLRKETAKIDALVSEQEKLIALLQEKRQAIISHAVTKGLDPKASMKDSGVECLGIIPAHWKTLRFKFLILKIESGTSVNATDVPAVNDELGVLKTSCVYHGDFDPAENKAVLPSEYARVSCPVRKMHLVVSRMNTPDLVGLAGLVKQDHENLFLPDRLWQVSVHGIHPALCHYWTHSYYYRVQVQMACSGTSSSMQNLSQDQFKNFSVPIPSAPEQVEILKFIESEISKIQLLRSEAEKAIALLKERRAALITAAVTGKIDVRGLA